MEQIDSPWHEQMKKSPWGLDPHQEDAILNAQDQDAESEMRKALGDHRFLFMLQMFNYTRVGSCFCPG